MFAYYVEVRDSGGLSAVAKRFNRGRSSVIRASRKYNWETRYHDIQRKVADKVDRTIAKKEIANIDMVRSIKKLVVKKLLEKAKEGNFDVNVRDAIAAIGFEEELLEKMPDAGKDKEYIPDMLQEALDILRQAGPALISKIGDMIGRGQVMIDDLFSD